MSTRNYGLGYSGEVIGKPIAEPIDDAAFQQSVKDSDGCPSCHCETIMQITVTLKSPVSPTGYARGIYLGCPACVWASPMVQMPIPSPEKTDG